VAEPYVTSIKRIAQIKARAQLTVVVVLTMCLLYMCAGAAHRTVLVWTYLVLAEKLLAPFCLLLVLPNKRLCTANEGLTAALEVFAHGKADLALREYAVTVLGPFALHITILTDSLHPFQVQNTDRTRLKLAIWSAFHELLGLIWTL
jgi:hypothetical protein